MSLHSTSASTAANPLLSMGAPAKPSAPSSTRDDAFSSALKQAEQNRRDARQAEATRASSERDETAPASENNAQAAAQPLDPAWLANMAAMMGLAQPAQAATAVDLETAFQTPEAGEQDLLLGTDSDGAGADLLGEESTASLLATASTPVDDFAGLLSSFPSKRTGSGAAALTSRTAPADLARSDAPLVDNVFSAPTSAAAQATGVQTAPVTGAAVSLAASAAPATADASAAVPTDAVAVTDVSAPTPTIAHGQTQGPHTALSRSELPAVPGAAASLHGQALQDRMDEAMRWMAGNGIQAAELKVNPDALGPITVQLRLQGDVANVVFSSAHEQTRQALEASLAGLRDALASGGLSLGQASVGSEQQQNLFADMQRGDGRAQQGGAASGRGNGPASLDGAPSTVPAPSTARAAPGLVNTYA